MNASTICYPAEDKATGQWRIIVLVKLVKDDKVVVKCMIAKGTHPDERTAAVYAGILQQQFMKVASK